ncbi:hypothetical protein DVH05_012332 [Phytophthora capsici]|nr:hypothetical protein DVH05_012332 [Phytophthora capsici]
MDRTGGSGKDDIGAVELAGFLQRNDLLDAGYYNMPNRIQGQEVDWYAQKHHTHWHKEASGKVGTSRLDRWYVSAKAKGLVRGQATRESPCGADHKEVLLELHSPSGATRLVKRSKIYPTPIYVQAASASLIAARLSLLQEALETADTATSAKLWDAFKVNMVNELMTTKREARRRTTRGHRQRIRRIKQQLEKCVTMENGSVKRQDLLKKLHEVQSLRCLLRR